MARLFRIIGIERGFVGAKKARQSRESHKVDENRISPRHGINFDAFSRFFPASLPKIKQLEALSSSMSGGAWFSSREIHPGHFEIAPLLELAPPQTWALDDECTEA